MAPIAQPGLRGHAAQGYDLNYTWGIGTHSNKQGGAILPDALRWLWRDYARPDDPSNDSDRAPLK